MKSSANYDARHQELRVVALAPRSSALYRSNARGSSELVAANLSLLPSWSRRCRVPDFFIVDRYLAAARCAGIAAACC